MWTSREGAIGDRNRHRQRLKINPRRIFIGNHVQKNVVSAGQTSRAAKVLLYSEVDLTPAQGYGGAPSRARPGGEVGPTASRAPTPWRLQRYLGGQPSLRKYSKSA